MYWPKIVSFFYYIPIFLEDVPNLAPVDVVGGNESYLTVHSGPFLLDNQ